MIADKFPTMNDARAALLLILEPFGWKLIGEEWNESLKHGDVTLRIQTRRTGLSYSKLHFEALMLEAQGPSKKEFRRYALKNCTPEKIEAARKVLQERAEAGKVAAENRQAARDVKYSLGEQSRALETEIGLEAYSLHQPSANNFEIKLRSLSENQVRAIAALLGRK